MARARIVGLGDGASANIAEIGGHGGKLASVLSAIALGFSGLSFYESVVKTADLEVYVPPVIQYARDKDGYIELFAVPVTVVNSGARTGTILSMELEAENLKTGAEPKTKRYYSAFLGEHSPRDDDINRAFAPLSLAGRATFSDTVRFYPIGNAAPKVVDDAGDYRFTLTLKTAVPADPGFFESFWRKEPAPITFERTLPSFSVQMLEVRRATIPMYVKDWKPAPPPTPE